MCIEWIKKIWNLLKCKRNRRIAFTILLIAFMIGELYTKSAINKYTILLSATFVVVVYFFPDYILAFIVIVYGFFIPFRILDTEIVYVNTQLLNLLLIIYSSLLVFIQLFSSNKQMMKLYLPEDEFYFYAVIFVMALTFYFTVKINPSGSLPMEFTKVLPETVNSYKLIYFLIAIYTLLFDSVLKKIDKIRSESKEDRSS